MNKIGEIGAASIADGGWTQLRSLILSSNNLCDAGATNLARAKWRQLQDLHLPYNRIGDSGAESIARAGWSLEELNFVGNKIGPQGINCLRAAFRQVFFE
jgi:hypothetical protein